MPERMMWIKIGCIERDRRMVDLAVELGIDGVRLSRIVGGFQNPPDRFERHVQIIFEKWDMEDGRQTLKATLT